MSLPTEEEKTSMAALADLLAIRTGDEDTTAATSADETKTDNEEETADSKEHVDEKADDTKDTEDDDKDDKDDEEEDEKDEGDENTDEGGDDEDEDSTETTDKDADKDDEETTKKKESKPSLTDQINKMAAEMAELGPTGKAAIAEIPEETLKRILLSPEEIDNVLDDPEILNKKLGLLIDLIKNQASSVAATATTQADRVVVMSELRNRFYDQHPTLREVGDFVKYTFNKNLAKAQERDDGTTIQKVLDETAKDVYELTNIKSTGKKSVSKKTRVVNKSGALPGTAGAKDTGKKTPKTGQAKHMDDMLKSRGMS